MSEKPRFLKHKNRFLGNPSLWKACGCRVRHMASDNIPARAQVSVVKSGLRASSSAAVATSPTQGTAVKKSHSGKRQTTCVRHMGLDPLKSRSGSHAGRGREKSGCKRLKELRLPVGDKEWKKFKYGSLVSAPEPFSLHSYGPARAAVLRRAKCSLLQ